MKREETQFILQSMRPDGQDRGEELCQEAMLQVEAVPELARWLEAEQAFDRAMAVALGSVQPPADLKSQILAGARAGKRVSWWKSGQALMVAAAVAVVMLVGSWWMAQDGAERSSLASFRKAMVTQLETMQGLPFTTAKVDEVRVWLAERSGEIPVGLPPGLASRSTIGCSVFEWGELQVTLICFRPESEVGSETAATHLFVVDSADVPDLVGFTRDPQLALVEAWSTLAWEADGQVYLMATRNPPETLEVLVDGAG